MLSSILKQIRIDNLDGIYKCNTVDVLRLDMIHPLISGNKWFKLKEYLDAAINTGNKPLVTFGGAWSNHLLATAAAAECLQLKSIGIIRGESSKNPSAVIIKAQKLGMEIVYLSRSDYRNKKLPQSFTDNFSPRDYYLIPEGGYGLPGARGAAFITAEVPGYTNYDYVVAAAGTGTTVAGLCMPASSHQTIIGISILKNHESLQKEIELLLPVEKQSSFSLNHDYSFGGYAKPSAELFVFMNQLFERTGIPTDFVYTGKLFYAVQELIQKKYFPEDSKILIIHSGGLWGNLSLPKGTLIF